MGPTPFYAARAEKKPQKADFAMKQTNICRLSGNIKNNSRDKCSQVVMVMVVMAVVVVVDKQTKLKTIVHFFGTRGCRLGFADAAVVTFPSESFFLIITGDLTTDAVGF